MKKSAILWLCFLSIVAAGCSDSNEVEEAAVKYYNDWIPGPDEPYVVRVFSVADGHAHSIVEESPFDDGTDTSYPQRSTRIIFALSDMSEANITEGSILPLHVKFCRRIKLEGLILQALYITHQYECVTEPFHGTITEGIEGTVCKTRIDDAWAIEYEQDGNRKLLFPMNLDSSFMKEGLQVVCSGELFTYYYPWEALTDEAKDNSKRDYYSDISRIWLTSTSVRQ